MTEPMAEPRTQITSFNRRGFQFLKQKLDSTQTSRFLEGERKNW